MDLELRGKTALVTGASRGIGRAIAAALHREGCQVMLNGRQESHLREAAASLGERVAHFAADVTDPSACEALVGATVERWGGLEILVCNVGSGASVPPGEETYPEWERVLRNNLFATTNMVQASREALSRDGGAIVCISSICGIETLGAPVTYSTAKAALNAFVRGIARPLAERKIRINAVAPGNIFFEGSVWDRRLAQDREGVESMLKREVALKRLGKPDEVADFCAFLASPRAGFATGGIFTLDGGQCRS